MESILYLGMKYHLSQSLETKLSIRNRLTHCLFYLKTKTKKSMEDKSRLDFPEYWSNNGTILESDDEGT